MTFAGIVRARRIERRGELRQRGIVPNRVTRVYRVDCMAIRVPVWARDLAFAGLSGSDRHVWLTRRNARALEQQDRDAGGKPLVTAVEYRRCPQCKRIMLGADAAERRRLNESARTGTMLPCDGECLERQRRGRV